MPITDLRGRTTPAREDEASRLTRAAARTPFDLAAGPLVRTRLLRLADDEHILVLTIHHIVSDGWSTDILLRELAACYGGFLSNTSVGLGELPVQYADFAAWQRDWLTGDVYESNRAYWADRLAPPLPTLELPGVRRPTTGASDEAATLDASIDASLLRRLRKLSRSEGVTLYTTLLAALNVLLLRYSGQDDIVVGTYVSGRMRSEIEPLIGFFVNTLVLRTDLSGDPSFREALRRTRDVVLGGQDHADFPFEKLVEELQPERSLTGSPFFPLDFNFQAYPLQAEPVDRSSSSRIFPPSSTMRTTDGLTFTAFDRKHALNLTIAYRPELFDEATIARMKSHLQVLLEGIVSNPAAQLSALPLLAPAERHYLLSDLNATDAALPDGGSFATYFEDQVRRSPDAIAAEDEQGTLTYRELDAHANRVAHELAEAGAGPGVPVALFGTRGLTLLTWIVATFKAGGVYLPLDPRQPALRHASMLRQSRASIALVADEYGAHCDAALDDIPAHARPRVILASELSNGAGDPGRLPPRAQPNDLAYMIFTSGSTGEPKGVMVSHRAMLNGLWSAIRDLDITAADVIAQTAPQGFDMSVWQFLAGLLEGARVRIVGEIVTAEPQRLFALIARERVTVADVVPSVLRAFLDDPPGRTEGASFGSLRWLVVGGEALDAGTCRTWLGRYPGTAIVNAYGPTECADVVTRQVVREAPGAEEIAVPIGRPIHNVRVYILDAHLAPVPQGVAGELCVGGACVGEGYVGDPARTDAVFVPDPFGGRAGARLYRTGDRALLGADGAIEFLWSCGPAGEDSRAPDRTGRDRSRRRASSDGQGSSRGRVDRSTRTAPGGVRRFPGWRAGHGCAGIARAPVGRTAGLHAPGRVRDASHSAENRQREGEPQGAAGARSAGRRAPRCAAHGDGTDGGRHLGRITRGRLRGCARQFLRARRPLAHRDSCHRAPAGGVGPRGASAEHLRAADGRRAGCESGAGRRIAACRLPPRDRR